MYIHIKKRTWWDFPDGYPFWWRKTLEDLVIDGWGLWANGWRGQE